MYAPIEKKEIEAYPIRINQECYESQLQIRIGKREKFLKTSSNWILRLHYFSQ